MAMGGGGGGPGERRAPSAQLSELPLQVGQEKCQVPSLPLTQTPMHGSIMDALHLCQREKDGGRRERDMGEGGHW